MSLLMACSDRQYPAGQWVVQQAERGHFHRNKCHACSSEVLDFGGALRIILAMPQENCVVTCIDTSGTAWRDDSRLLQGDGLAGCGAGMQRAVLPEQITNFCQARGIQLHPSAPH